MNNKLNLKKYITMCIIIFLIFIVLFLLVSKIQYNQYTKNVNIALNQMIVNIKENYPDVDINEIIRILNSANPDTSNLLEEYGINIQKDSAVLQNNWIKYIVLDIIIVFFLFVAIIIIFVLYQKSQNKKINEITKYIEELNNRNYALDIQDNDEDELSLLKNELYKVTIMLKEQAENSKNDKIGLKKSLEDISHQLKTPLTSITIMLDNILDNPNMDIDTRNEFIKDIYREISNINFFVQSLLKLSKFDADTIVFNDKVENLKNIAAEAIKNVSPICDLKNIEVVLSSENETKSEFQINTKFNSNINKKVVDKEIEPPQILCDFKWQVEAVTNILKNSVEHSKENSKVYVYYGENNMYSEIVIKDNGTGMDKQDLKHIFERFYKAKNSSKDSVGIGLALAKTIIEKDNGYITVESELNIGTTFFIRYLK